MNHPPEYPDSLGPTAIPKTGRVLGIDYGTARIGIAVSDPQQSFASPMEIRQSQGKQRDAVYFAELALGENAVGIVVGLPLHMSGDASKKSKEAEAFGQWLHDVTVLPVDWIDERYSTAMAHEICREMGLNGAKRKAHLDRIAAQVILTSWLERGRDDSTQRLIPHD